MLRLSVVLACKEKGARKERRKERIEKGRDDRSERGSRWVGETSKDWMRSRKQERKMERREEGRDDRSE